MIGIPQGPELIVILVVILVLFGAKRLPELGRSLGQGIKEFKKSSKGLLSDDDDQPEEKEEKKAEDAA